MQRIMACIIVFGLAGKPAGLVPGSFAQVSGSIATVAVSQPLPADDPTSFISFPVSITNTSKQQLSFTVDYSSFTPQLYDQNDPQHSDLWLPVEQEILSQQPTNVTVIPSSFLVEPSTTAQVVFPLDTSKLSLHTGSYSILLTIEEDNTHQVIASSPVTFQVVIPTK